VVGDGGGSVPGCEPDPFDWENEVGGGGLGGGGLSCVILSENHGPAMRPLEKN
jgi:hypothetical protein